MNIEAVIAALDLRGGAGFGDLAVGGIGQTSY